MLASDVSIQDIKNIIVATNVEDALQEIDTQLAESATKTELALKQDKTYKLIQSDLSETLQAQMITNSLALNTVPADGSVTIQKVSGVVSVPNKNLFDKVGMVQATSIDSNGVIGTNAGWIGAKIPVSPSEVYSFRHLDDAYLTTLVGKLAYLDSNSAILSTIDMSTLASATVGTGKQLTTPSNTAYIFMNSKVLTHDYVDTLQLELGSSVTAYEAYNLALTKIVGAYIADGTARASVASLTVAQQTISTDLYTALNDNKNYALNTIDTLDWYQTASPLFAEVCTNAYLLGLGIAKWIHFDVGEALSTDRRDVFYKQKYSTVIKGKYFQTVFYINTVAGVLPSEFVLNTVFASVNGSDFTSITPTETTVTPVDGQTKLWKVRKSGLIPTTAEFTQIWIGSSLNTVTGSTPDLNVAGFYAKVDTVNMLGIDAFPTLVPQMPRVIQNTGDIVSLSARLTAIEKTYIPKNIVFMGDSITADPTWWTVNLLARMSFANFLNVARSGATWSHLAGTVYDITSTGGSTTSDNVIWNQVNKLIDKVTNLLTPIPHVVIILAGTNDFSRPIGVATTAFAGASPITGLAPGSFLDVATAIRYSCELLLNTYPDVQIILTTPIQRGLDDNSVIFSLGQVIKDCGGNLSTQVIDQGKECGIYGKYDVGATVKYLTDDLHPNAAGREKIGAYMASKLKNVITQ
ncbi:MAG TPA: SGNH/GDSL hydrolase family protein [Clostridium sp.]